MTEKAVKPQIRFAGFNGAWEQRKLGDKMYLKARIGWQALTKQEYLQSGNYYLITGTDIDEESHIVDLKRCFYISKERYDMDEKIQVQEGDIIVTKDGTIGKVAMITGLDKPATLNSHLFVLRDLSGKLDNCFLLHLLNSHIFKTFVESTKTGSTLTGMPQKTLTEFSFLVPNMKEQRKIACYFMKLNHLIALHQRKYGKLTQVKKSMLEKMFPKNGRNVPEIRFKGFSDAWEQRKFSDIIFLAGEKNKDNIPYESYSVTNEHGFIPQNEQFENGGTMATADKSMYYIVSKNSFAYNPARINVGSIGYYDNPKNVIVSSLYEVFKTTNDIDDRFLWHWFKSDSFQKMIEQYQEGGVRLYFYYDKLCMCSLSVPSLQEQQKIGKQLDTLDHLIALHQRELEMLKNIKKAMLEKMFV